MAWSAPAGGRHGPAGHDPDTTVPVRMWCRSARSGRSRMLTAEIFLSCSKNELPIRSGPRWL